MCFVLCKWPKWTLARLYVYQAASIPSDCGSLAIAHSFYVLYSHFGIVNKMRASLLFFVSVALAAPKAQLDLLGLDGIIPSAESMASTEKITGALGMVQKSVTDLDGSVNKVSPMNIGALGDVATKSDSLGKTIKTAQTMVEGADKLDISGAIQLMSSADGLTGSIDKLSTDLIKIKPTVDQAGLSPVVAMMLQKQMASSGGFSKAVASKVPDLAQDQAKETGDKVMASLMKVVKAYQAPPVKAPAPAPAPAASNTTAASGSTSGNQAGAGRGNSTTSAAPNGNRGNSTTSASPRPNNGNGNIGNSNNGDRQQGQQAGQGNSTLTSSNSPNNSPRPNNGNGNNGNGNSNNGNRQQGQQAGQGNSTLTSSNSPNASQRPNNGNSNNGNNSQQGQQNQPNSPNASPRPNNGNQQGQQGGSSANASPRPNNGNQNGQNQNGQNQNGQNQNGQSQNQNQNPSQNQNGNRTNSGNNNGSLQSNSGRSNGTASSPGRTNGTSGNSNTNTNSNNNNSQSNQPRMAFVA